MNVKNDGVVKNKEGTNTVRTKTLKDRIKSYHRDVDTARLGVRVYQQIVLTFRYVERTSEAI
jgi:hypothetical protein